MDNIKKLKLELTGLELLKEIQFLLDPEDTGKGKQEYLAVWLVVMAYQLQGKACQLADICQQLKKTPDYRRVLSEMVAMDLLEADNSIITKANYTIIGFKGYTNEK